MKKYINMILIIIIILIIISIFLFILFFNKSIKKENNSDKGIVYNNNYDDGNYKCNKKENNILNFENVSIDSETAPSDDMNYSINYEFNIIVKNNKIEEYNKMTLIKFNSILAFNTFINNDNNIEYGSALKNSDDLTITLNTSMEKEQLSETSSFYLQQLEESNYKCVKE